MPNEPLLTRKSYKEQLENRIEKLEESIRRKQRERRDKCLSSFEGVKEGFHSEREKRPVHRTPKTGLRKYNHFLNVRVCFGSSSLCNYCKLAIQMFFLE